MNQNRRTVLGIGVLVTFALLVLSASLYIEDRRTSMFQRFQAERLDNRSLNFTAPPNVTRCLECERESRRRLPPELFIPFAAFSGVLVGTLVYYLMSEQVVEKDESLKKNTDMMLDLLSQDERKIVDKLKEKGGEAKQYEFSKLPGMNKVSVHRAIKKLKGKGVVEKKPLGRTNKIVLKEDLYDILGEE